VTGIRIGALILPEHRWEEATPRWRRAEELGLDHVWTYDHLTWRSFRDRAWFGAVPTLAAAAVVTQRIRIGMLVASPNFRHPVPFAKEVVTLDDISRGRLTVGLGAGADGWDATMLGNAPWSRRERADRFAEFVSALDVLLREPSASFAGTFYSADEARTVPGCVQQPRVPFAVAATGPRGMALAAGLGDVWVTTGDRTQAPGADAVTGARMVSQQVARLEDACAAQGRDPSTVDRLVLTGPQLDPCLSSPAAFVDACGHYTEAGVTDLVVHWPRPDEPYRGDEAAFERAVTDRG